MKFAIAYVATLAAFLIVDFAWLGWVAKPLYRREIGSLLLPSFNFPVAGGFYLLYCAGIVVFAVVPALRSESLATAAGLGALLGLIAYGTYDLTNLATLRGWTTTMAVVDMAWGAVLTAIAAGAGYLAASRLMG